MEIFDWRRRKATEVISLFVASLSSLIGINWCMACALHGILIARVTVLNRTLEKHVFLGLLTAGTYYLIFWLITISIHLSHDRVLGLHMLRSTYGERIIV